MAAEAIKPMCELQYELAKEKGTDVKREYDHEINDDEPKAETQFTVEAEEDIKSLTVEQLKNYAQEKGIDLDNAVKKADILEAVTNSLAVGGK